MVCTGVSRWAPPQHKADVLTRPTYNRHTQWQVAADRIDIVHRWQLCDAHTLAVRLLAGISLEDLQRNPKIASQADSYGMIDAQGAYLGPKAGAAASLAAVRGECA
jgi:hypothetical protein